MLTPIRPIPDDPRPGDFVLSVITGVTGFWVRMAQAVIGDTTKYTHAALVVDEDGTLVEAMPGGARYNHLNDFRDQDVYYHNAYYLSEEQRAAVSVAGHAAVGTPYSFTDYLALGASHLGWEDGWLHKYVSSNGRMICSQLVDECHRRGGNQLFTDGRRSQDVTPGDLFWYALTRDLAKP